MKVYVVFLLVVYGTAWALSRLQGVPYSNALSQVYFVVFTTWLNWSMPVIMHVIDKLFLTIIF